MFSNKIKHFRCARIHIKLSRQHSLSNMIKIFLVCEITYVFLLEFSVSLHLYSEEIWIWKINCSQNWMKVTINKNWQITSNTIYTMHIDKGILWKLTLQEELRDLFSPILKVNKYKFGRELGKGDEYVFKDSIKKSISHGRSWIAKVWIGLQSRFFRD